MQKLLLLQPTLSLISYLDTARCALNPIETYAATVPTVERFSGLQRLLQSPYRQRIKTIYTRKWSFASVEEKDARESMVVASTSYQADPHATVVFSLRLPIILPILQAASIAANVGANPTTISISESIKLTIAIWIEYWLILILLDQAYQLSYSSLR